MILNLQEVARAVQAAGDFPPLRATGWSVDSRTLEAGDLYFALRGPNHDGHEYVAAAMEKGAVAVVVEKPAGAPRELVVSDSLGALQTLGAWARRRWGGTVVAVTGSAGKTTTKDAIAHLLSVDRPVGKNAGNLNNHVGVPLSILRLPGDCRFAVLEIGMNHAGEIRDLAAIARPDVGVVTNVGYAHMEFLGSIEGVAAAKRELIEALPPDGVAVLNADDERVFAFRQSHAGRTIAFGLAERADVRAEAVEFGDEGARFRALGVDFETRVAGRHGVMNMLAALAVARAFDISPQRLRDAVHTFAPGSMRGERTVHRGIVVWNDCYNSNPEAANSMIDVLRATPAARRIAVLGEMLELGEASEALHRQVGRHAAGQGIDGLIGVRGMARAMVQAAMDAGLPARAAHFFEDAAEAGEAARREARPGDAILFKGSRGVRIERALERFLK
ncbi:MAG: UDP-N-acetylmuramoyl-tripeptide--D-alanyl-D-alanine ligase [Bryobacteraceae bacterium]